MKDSNKIIKNKKIHARSIRQLDKLDRLDGMDDNQDDIIDSKHKGRSNRSRRISKRDNSDDEDTNVGNYDEPTTGGGYQSDLLRHDEIDDRLERQLKE